MNAVKTLSNRLSVKSNRLPVLTDDSICFHPTHETFFHRTVNLLKRDSEYRQALLAIEDDNHDWFVSLTDYLFANACQTWGTTVAFYAGRAVPRFHTDPKRYSMAMWGDGHLLDVLGRAHKAWLAGEKVTWADVVGRSATSPLPTAVGMG
jgi:hypothetical protein